MSYEARKLLPHQDEGGSVADVGADASIRDLPLDVAARECADALGDGAWPHVPNLLQGLRALATRLVARGPDNRVPAHVGSSKEAVEKSLRRGMVAWVSQPTGVTLSCVPSCLRNALYGAGWDGLCEGTVMYPCVCMCALVLGMSYAGLTCPPGCTVVQCSDPCLRATGIAYMTVSAASFRALPTQPAQHVLSVITGCIRTGEVQGTRCAAIALLGELGHQMVLSLTAPGQPPLRSAVPRWALDDALLMFGRPYGPTAVVDGVVTASGPTDYATLKALRAHMNDLTPHAALAARIVASLVGRLSGVFNWHQLLAHEESVSSPVAAGHTNGSDEAAMGVGGQVDMSDAGTHPAHVKHTLDALVQERVYLYHAVKRVVPLLSSVAASNNSSAGKAGARTHDGGAVSESSDDEDGQTGSQRDKPWYEQPGVCSDDEHGSSKAAAIVQHLVLVELDPSQRLALPVFLSIAKVAYASGVFIHGRS